MEMNIENENEKLTRRLTCLLNLFLTHIRIWFLMYVYIVP